MKLTYRFTFLFVILALIISLFSFGLDNAVAQTTVVTIPTPLSPTGDIADNTPTYSWTKITGATSYKYTLYQGVVKVYSKTVAASACGSTKCNHTPIELLSLGEYQWQVQALVAGSWKSPSSYLYFREVSPIPTLHAPIGDTVETPPTFVWSVIPGATKYKYQLYKDAVLVYTKTAYPGECDASECSQTPAEELTTGDFQWRIKAYVGGLWKPWSSYTSFFLNTNPLTGSGKLDGNGIPADFFGDVHIRKAFSYSFDLDTYIIDVYGGNAVQAIELPMPGMPGYDEDAPHYTFDLTQAEAEFKLADLDHDGIPAGDETDGSDIWNLGFHMTLVYNEGNSARQAFVQIIADSISSLNDKFIVSVASMTWADYSSYQRAGRLPLFTAGWMEDLHDPHNWYVPYTIGNYGGWQRMPETLKDQFRAILNAGVLETDPVARSLIYYQANQLYYDQAVGIPLVLTTGHTYEQRWISGRVKNPLLPGIYYYPVSKSADSPNPTTSVYANSATFSTLDPALAYDTSSSEVLYNIYDSLIFYEGEKTDSFLPQLADSWQVSADGKVWTFHIRPGVTFHNGNPLTASDVAYTFQRGLLQGGYASPQWLLSEPFLGVGIDDITGIVDGFKSADNRAKLKKNDPAVLLAACKKVRNKIVADDAAGTVTMTLAQPWGPFLGTLAGSWGSILDKQWVVGNGGWNGSCNTWQNYYAMTVEEDPLTGIANGTGPYELQSWTWDVETVLIANTNYWRTVPAYPGGPSGIPSITTVTFKVVPDTGDRYTMLSNGTADFAVMNNADGLVGETCVWDLASGDYAPCTLDDDALPLRLYSGKPNVVSKDVVIFTFDIQ